MVVIDGKLLKVKIMVYNFCHWLNIINDCTKIWNNLPVKHPDFMLNKQQQQKILQFLNVS